MSRRLREFDFMRAFAALSVIAIHISASYVTDFSLARYLNEITRYAVPLFIVVSGFLLFYSDRERERVPYITFLQKRFGKVLWPYLFWTLLYVIYDSRHFLRVHGLESISQLVRPILKDLYMGTGYYHLYFLVIIVQLYLLYPLLRFLCRRYAVLLLASTFLLTVVAQTALYIHHNMWYFTLFPHWIFYFVFGMFIALKKEQTQIKIQGKPLYLGIVWAASFLILMLDGKLTNSYASSIKPSIILYTLTSFFFFYTVAMQLKATTNKLGHFFDWISVQSFLVFLLHPLILSLLRLFAEKWHVEHVWDGIAGMVGLYLATVTVTVLLTYVVSLLPIASIIGGVSVKKRKKLPGQNQFHNTNFS